MNIWHLLIALTAIGILYAAFRFGVHAAMAAIHTAAERRLTHDEKEEFDRLMDKTLED